MGPGPGRSWAGVPPTHTHRQLGRSAAAVSGLLLVTIHSPFPSPFPSLGGPPGLPCVYPRLPDPACSAQPRSTSLSLAWGARVCLGRGQPWVLHSSASPRPRSQVTEQGGLTCQSWPLENPLAAAAWLPLQMIGLQDTPAEKNSPSRVHSWHVLTLAPAVC